MTYQSVKRSLMNMNNYSLMTGTEIRKQTAMTCYRNSTQKYHKYNFLGNKG